MRDAWLLLFLLGCVEQDRQKAPAPPPAVAGPTVPASPAAPRDEGPWVIRPGADVATIVAPLAPGAVVIPGWKLAGVTSDPASIVVRATKGKKDVRLRLIHHESPEDAQARGPSFKMQILADPSAPKESIDVGVKLIEIVTINDDGSLWVRQRAGAAAQ